MFVDASALVSMIAGESDSRALAAGLETATVRLTSPIAVFESALAVSRILSISTEDAVTAVENLLRIASIRVMPVPVEATPLALEAFARYGKGQGHPARLNMGDCFAYACARHFGVPLLFKEEDFARTDIESAMD